MIFKSQSSWLLLLQVAFFLASTVLQANVILIAPGEIETAKHSFKLKIDEKQGRNLHHDNAWEILFPQGFANRKLNFVRIHFNQAIESGKGENPKRWDENGAYLSFSCHDSSKNSWHKWSDQFGSEKFATPPPRRNRNVFNRIQSLVEILPLRMRTCTIA